MSKIRSHVQVPSFILKQFMDVDNRIWYLDLTDMSIKKTGPRLLGTKKGLYSSKTEQLLSVKIEAPLSQACTELFKFISNGLGDIDRIKNIEKVDLALRRYIIHSFVSRSDSSFDSIKNSTLGNGVTFNSRNDFVFETVNLTMLDYLFADYKFNFFVNTTDRKFVIPRNCAFLFADSTGLEWFAAPISPTCLVVLYPRTLDYKYLIDGKLVYCLVDDERVVDSMNKRALHTEIHHNNKFVASNSKSELDILKNYLETKSKNKLNQ